MKRFKVGDMAKIINAGEHPKLPPYVGTVCEILQLDKYCHCIFCFIDYGPRGGHSDYLVGLCDGKMVALMDPQLAPIDDPDAGVKEEQNEEQNEELKA